MTSSPNSLKIVQSPLIPLNLQAAAPALLHALEFAAQFIKDQDGGNPDGETGWASDEYLDAWLKCRMAISLAKGEGK